MDDKAVTTDYTIIFSPCFLTLSNTLFSVADN